MVRKGLAFDILIGVNLEKFVDLSSEADATSISKDVEIADQNNTWPAVWYTFFSDDG